MARAAAARRDEATVRSMCVRAVQGPVGWRDGGVRGEVEDVSEGVTDGGVVGRELSECLSQMQAGASEVAADGGGGDAEQLTDLFGCVVVPVGEVDNGALLHAERGDGSADVEVACRNGVVLGQEGVKVTDLATPSGTLLGGGRVGDRCEDR